MKHLRYLRYVIRHKWYVALACFRRGLYWQGIIHDWSKLLPSEWFAYAEFFYGTKYTAAEREQAARLGIFLPYNEEVIQWKFDEAWLKHQHRNPHHWQHWVLHKDDGGLTLLEMPRRYRLEMLADWEGAGRAITGRKDWQSWYVKNAHRMQLHPSTRGAVEDELPPTVRFRLAPDGTLRETVDTNSIANADYK